MSQENPPIHPKKKSSKNSFILSHDNWKLPISSSCASDIATKNSQNLKTETSKDNKIVPDYCKSSMRIDKTVSNANLSTRKLWHDASKTPRNSYIHAPTNGTIEEESEVISMLTKQLNVAESQIRKMQSAVAKAEEGSRTKDQEIGRLKRKVKNWETKYKDQELLRKKEQRTQANNSEYFYQRCLTLEHKIAEMEKFLADYGLVWVGDTKNTAKMDSGSNNYIDACYNQLVANIDQLNLAAGKGEVHIYHNEKGGGATFKTPSCMALKFYKNGMTVQGGPLRSYDDPIVRSFIGDILDGYFPSELQQEYPNGVPFMIEDHRTELYVSNSVGFPGQGYRLGKQSPVDKLLSTNLRESNNVSQRYSHVGSLPKDNTSNSENIPFLSLPTSRLSKPTVSSETSSINLSSLRSQILASHNNVCSNSHLQSHINAELARSCRREKRELATKNIEYYASSKERSLKSRDALRPLGSSRTTYHSPTERSSSPFSLNRTGLRPRSRSASLPGGRPTVSMQSVLRTKTVNESTAEFNNTDKTKIINSVVKSTVMKRPRSSKSATCARKNSPPLLHQINEATGKSGELRLKVRSLTGSTVFLVHVLADESVAKLYELLDKAMQTFGYKRYKVVLSGYSPKRLERVNASLRESGINRDCVLHLIND